MMTSTVEWEEVPRGSAIFEARPGFKVLTFYNHDLFLVCHYQIDLIWGLLADLPRGQKFLSMVLMTTRVVGEAIQR